MDGTASGDRTRFFFLLTRERFLGPLDLEARSRRASVSLVLYETLSVSLWVESPILWDQFLPAAEIKKKYDLFTRTSVTFDQTEFQLRQQITFLEPYVGQSYC